MGIAASNLILAPDDKKSLLAQTDHLYRDMWEAMSRATPGHSVPFAKHVGLEFQTAIGSGRRINLKIAAIGHQYYPQFATRRDMKAYAKWAGEW